MAKVLDLDEYETEKRQALGQTVNYCPCGCKDEDLDEYGYCPHLVGFTNDKKTFEPVGPLMRKDRDGESYDTGFKTVLAPTRKNKMKPQPVLPTDKLVNPEFRQKSLQGIITLAHKFVSWRVYRAQPTKKE